MGERVSGATGAAGTEAFARLLRELKDRSGLSYGMLAKRLHMSTSTLHRYCNGSAVPVDYAPVERLARACRATPQELVELHRRWILADAARGLRAEPGRRPETGPDQDAGQGRSPGADQGPGPGRVAVTGSGSGSGSAQGAGSADAAHAAHAGDAPDPVDAVDAAVPRPAAPYGQSKDEGEGKREGIGEGEHRESVLLGAAGDLASSPLPRGPGHPRRRRTVLIAAVAVAAVLGGVALTVRPPFGGGDGAGDRRVAGAGAEVTGTAPTGKASASPSPTAKERKPSASVSASATASAKAGASEGAGSATSKGGGAQGAPLPAGAVPLTVNTRPYVYESPCSQHFLVDSEPAQVGPPASEQDAPRWAAAYGAVSSGEQRIALTVQGTGEDTVVLEALHVRVLTKGAPLAWNDYSMGVGCGGGVEAQSFGIGLDSGSPTVTAKNGQRDFPYKVSESDPEVFYVTARTTAYDVRWDLTLDWSSGGRRGSVHIDNAGTPFRTSADTGRPGYDYPNGGGEWIDREG